MKWEVKDSYSDGFTLIVGCMYRLPELAIANLNLIAKLSTTKQFKVLFVFDCTESELPQSFKDFVEREIVDLDFEVLFYDDKQVEVSRRANWGWVYSWMSWCIGISKAKTRHVILHDLDALPLTTDIFESCYSGALDNDSAFHGIQLYQGNGVMKEQELVTTFQLVINVPRVVGSFEPIDAFNKLEYQEGKIVDYDTFLWMQRKLGSSSYSPIDETMMFHPTQVICQYTDFVSGRNNLTGIQHNLLALIYLRFLGGNEEAIIDLLAQLKESNSETVVIDSKSLSVAHLSCEHWAWLEKQIRRVEQTLYGLTRKEVAGLLEIFAENSKDKRTVGVESVEIGGVGDF